MLYQPNKQPLQASSSWWLDLAWLTLLIGMLFFILLGSRPLFVPDEGRYAEIAREMVSSGDYITPTLNGIIYFEKPILFYWLSAVAFKLSATSLIAVRSINALLGLIGCLLTYVVGRHLYDRLTGFLAAIILASNLLYFTMAHMVSLDLTVTFFIMACLYAFLMGTRCSNLSSNKRYFYFAATAAGLAVLTKGLIGIVLPVMIIFAYVLIENDLRQLRKWPVWQCGFIFLLITLPWHGLAQLRHSEFFHFYFIEQHVLRYTDQSVGHYEPIWFFIPYLAIGFLPWIVFLPQALLSAAATNRKSNQDNAARFFLIWATVIFLFFSFSKSKLIPYILPLFPALAMLTARYLALKCHSVAPFRNMITMLFIITYIGLISLMAAFPKWDTRTVRPLANILLPILKPNDDVITYNQYYQDLPFYLQRRVSILNWQNELQFGMQLQDTRDWMINDATFLQRFQSNHRVFVFISLVELEKWHKKYPHLHFHLLGKTTTNALISNIAS